MYLVKSGKRYWCNKSQEFYAGWACLNDSRYAVDIWATSDKAECRRKYKYLRKKYCLVKMRLCEIKDPKKLELLTLNKLKQNVWN